MAPDSDSVVYRGQPIHVAAWASRFLFRTDQLELSEAYRALERCLGGLDTDKQAIVRLAYLDGWSREQLAERFGAPVPTIKTWLHRSLKQLKDCLSS